MTVTAVSRLNRAPVGIALAAVPIILVLELWLRPHVAPGSLALRLLGVAPNFIASLCIPFIVVARPTRSPLEAARAFTLATLGTFGVLLVIEVGCAAVGVARFDPFDIAASVVGLLLGAALYRRLAPTLGYVPTSMR